MVQLSGFAKLILLTIFSAQRSSSKCKNSVTKKKKKILIARSHFENTEEELIDTGRIRQKRM